MPAFSDVSFSLYTTLIRGDSMGLPEDELQSLTAQPWDDCVCPIESGRDEQGVMSTLLIAHHDLRLGDLDLGGGIHGEIRCQFIILARGKSGGGKSGVSASFLPEKMGGGNPVSVHHSCPKR